MNIHGLKKASKGMTLMLRNEEEGKDPCGIKIARLMRAKRNCKILIKKKRLERLEKRR